MQSYSKGITEEQFIQLFADILRKNLSQEFFKAHIGGDDFFSGVKTDEENEEKYVEQIFKIITKFTNDVIEFYSQEDKKNGYLRSTDRDGNVKNFPLLTVSASLLIIHKNTKDRCLEGINILSIQKKVAKKEEKSISISTLL